MVENDYRDMRFLIIDDFESFQKILKRILHGLNAKHIDTALNALKAIDACKTVKYDVLFCDFDLGKGANGLQLFEELRHQELLGHGTIFIMVTAESSRDAVLGSLEYKPDAYMNKPISSGELQSRLIKCLKQKEALRPIYNTLDEGDYKKALDQCDDHISKGTRYKNWALKTKCSIFQKLARWSSAQEIYESVLAERPLFWAQLGYAEVLAAQNLDDDAYRAYKQCYEDNPQSLEAYEGAAKMLIKLGDTLAAQKLLQKTSALSSRSYERQKLLAEVCNMNGDYESAVDAYRQVVKVAQNTFHQSAENELDLADNLTEAAIHSSDKDKNKEFARQAFETLNDTQKQYDDLDVRLQSKLIESRAHSAVDDNVSADAALREAVNKIDGAENSVHSLRTHLELAKTYLLRKEKEKAFELLKTLAHQYKDDPAISAKLDRLVDEPVSQSGKTEVVKINKEGIKLFDEGNYSEAAQYFIKATQQFPRHVGIRLNVIQAMLFNMKKLRPTQQQLDLCHQHLKSLRSLPEDHNQFKRYQSFFKTVDSLQNHINQKQSEVDSGKS